MGLITSFWFDGSGVALGWWILILARFCSVEVGGVTEKLDGGGGGGWLREREIEIKERSEKCIYIIFILYYIILMCSMVK